jgi:leucyl aminopeptidase
MQSTSFYTTNNKDARILSFVTEEQWKSDSSIISQTEKTHLKTQQFDGKLGAIGLIFDVDGHLKHAYVGSGDGNVAIALAHAATKLPPYVYALKESGLPETSLIIWALAQYRFETYKKTSCEPRVLVVHESQLQAIIQEVDAVFLARDLINQPTNALGPSELSKVVHALCLKNGATFKEWIGDALLSDNFPAIHAVGRAAKDAPRLLQLTWGNPTHPRIAVVGKGVCFDSGGLNLKPGNAMRLMKKDMGGAAIAIGLAQWIMAIKLPIYLDLYIPAVENAVSLGAYRPGDVLTMRSGLTVEIDNTDAEGRLVMADAITKACETPLDLLVDFSTLTGAARIAVGTEISAMFTNEDTLAHELEIIASKVVDPVWRLPLYAGYESLLYSSIADVVNSSSSSYAGAITAALFLQKFVPKKVSFVHFDLMAWNVTSTPGKPEGGEAMAMRTVAHYLMKRFGV